MAISQAEKSLRAAQTGAQQNAKAVEKENALRAERERRLQQMAEEAGREEEEEEDDDLPGSTDPESEIDRREEENLEFNQQIPYEYTVS